jgi:hypothetical protein
LPPVTRQQLQLVVSAVVQADWEALHKALLLLVLLLQRADPGLRAAFLNGPEASLLLVTLVTWGCHDESSAPGIGMGVIPGKDCPTMVSSLRAAWGGQPVQMHELPLPNCALLMLAQLYLQPAAGWQQAASKLQTDFTLVVGHDGE